jgi:hypothetical protein
MPENFGVVRTNRKREQVFCGKEAEMGTTSVIISNPQSNPQCMMSCATSAYFGSPRVDTVEVCGSSPHGPTIFFSELASTTFLDQAPIGSIKEGVRNYQGHFLIFLREDTGPPDALLTGQHISRPFRIRKYSARFAGRGGSLAQQTELAREERSPKAVRLSLHACGRRQTRPTHVRTIEVGELLVQFKSTKSFQVLSVHARACLAFGELRQFSIERHESCWRVTSPLVSPPGGEYEPQRIYCQVIPKGQSRISPDRSGLSLNFG